MFMATKTITITKDAYDALKLQKNKDESFSQVIKRITDSKKGTTEAILKFAGAWADVPDKKIEEIKQEIERGRKLSDERLEDLYKEK